MREDTWKNERGQLEQDWIGWGGRGCWVIFNWIVRTSVDDTLYGDMGIIKNCVIMKMKYNCTSLTCFTSRSESVMVAVIFVILYSWILDN